MNSVTEAVIVLISFACRHLTAESAAVLHAPQQLVWRTSYEQHSASAQSDTGSHSYSYSRTVQRGPDGAGYAHAEGHYSSPQGSQVRGSRIHIRPSGKDSVLSITSTPGLESYPLCQSPPNELSTTSLRWRLFSIRPHAPHCRCPLVGWPSHVVIIIVYHQRCGCRYYHLLYSLSFSDS